MTHPPTLAQRFSALQINAPILNPGVAIDLHEALIAVVSAAERVNNLRISSLLEKPLADLSAAIEKAEG